MRRLATIALFSAAVVAVGLLFLSIPNLELVTMTCFLAGYFLGVRHGVLAAAIGEALYSILNPLGMAGVPLLVAQILGMSLVAFTAGIVARRRKQATEPNDSKLKTIIYFGSLGLLLTVFFDMLTTVSFLIFAGFSPEKFLSSLVFGMYFYLTHIGVNTLVFALVLPPTIRRLTTWLATSPGMQT